MGGAALGVILVGPQLADSAGRPAVAAHTTTARTDPAAARTAPAPGPSAPQVSTPSAPAALTTDAPPPSTVPAGAPAATASGAPSTVPATGRTRPAGGAAPSAGVPAVPVNGPGTTTSPTRDAPAAVPTPDPTPGPAAPSGNEESRVLALVNQARAAAGCAAVTTDPGLTAVALAHSTDMRDRDYFDHTDPDGLSPFDRADRAGATNARAENIARGQDDAAAVVAAWLDSPGHRDNILNCSYRTVGLGMATGTGGPWWTQLFGS